MKEVRMLWSLIFRVLIVFVGWCAWSFMIYGFGSGMLPLWDHGLAADSDGNVYVGSTMYIHVYSPEGEFLNELDAQTSRGYSFTILNDELHIAHSDKVSVLDLQGNLLRMENYDLLSWHWVSDDYFTAENGTQYKLVNHLGRKAVMMNTADGWTPIVKMPMETYGALLICFALVAFAALSVLSIANQFKNDRF